MANQVNVFEVDLINNLNSGSYNNTIAHGLNATPRYVVVTLSDGTVFNALPWKPDPSNPLKNILLSWGTDSGENLNIYIQATSPIQISPTCCK